MKLEHPLRLNIKINSGWITVLSVRPDTRGFPEEDVGRAYTFSIVAIIFLDLSPKANINKT